MNIHPKKSEFEEFLIKEGDVVFSPPEDSNDEKAESLHLLTEALSSYKYPIFIPEEENEKKKNTVEKSPDTKYADIKFSLATPEPIKTFGDDSVEMRHFLSWVKKNNIETTDPDKPRDFLAGSRLFYSYYDDYVYPQESERAREAAEKLLELTKKTRKEKEEKYGNLYYKYYPISLILIVIIAISAIVFLIYLKN